jgi:hypothetical protein
MGPALTAAIRLFANIHVTAKYESVDTRNKPVLDKISHFDRDMSHESGVDIRHPRPVIFWRDAQIQISTQRSHASSPGACAPWLIVSSADPPDASLFL